MDLHLACDGSHIGRLGHTHRYQTLESYPNGMSPAPVSRYFIPRDADPRPFGVLAWSGTGLDWLDDE